MESNKEDIIGGKLNVPDNRKESATYTVPGNKEGKEALTAEQIFEKQARENMTEYNSINFLRSHRTLHKVIISSMLEFASIKVAESRKANNKSEDTLITNLRNKLTPFFNLVALVNDESVYGTLKAGAKSCDTHSVKKLISEIESGEIVPTENEFRYPCTAIRPVCYVKEKCNDCNCEPIK